MVKKRVVLNSIFLWIIISLLVISYVNAQECPNSLQVMNMNTRECCPLGQVINPEGKCVDPKPEIVSFEMTSAQDPRYRRSGFIVRVKGWGTSPVQAPGPAPLLMINGFVVGGVSGTISGISGYSADTHEAFFPITDEVLSVVEEGKNSLTLLDMTSTNRNPEKNAVRIKFNAKKDGSLIELESVDYTNDVIGQSMMDTGREGMEGKLNHYLGVDVRGKDFDDFCSFSDLYINGEFAKTVRTDYNPVYTGSGKFYLDLTEELNIKLNEYNVLELKKQGGTETIIAHKVLITDKEEGINKFISVVPDYGSIGDEVVIYGDGFSPNKELIIQQGYGDIITGWRNTKIKTDEYGKFETSLKISQTIRGYLFGAAEDFLGIFKTFTSKKEGREVKVTSRMEINVKSEGIGTNFMIIEDKEQRICE